MAVSASNYFKNIIATNGTLSPSLKYSIPFSPLMVIAPITSIRASSTDDNTIASELDGFGGTAKDLFPITTLFEGVQGSYYANGTTITLSASDSSLGAIDFMFPSLSSPSYDIQRGERVDLFTTTSALLRTLMAQLSEVDEGSTGLTLSDLARCVTTLDANGDLVLVGTMRTSRAASDPYLEALGAATDVVSGTTAIIGVVTGGFSAAADMQVIGALAMSTCADPHLRSAFGSYRALSPFALSNSYIGVIAGNAVAYVAVFVLQVLALLCLRLVKGDAAQWAELSAMIWFPGVTLSAMAALHTGTGYASSQLVSLPGPAVEELAVGAVGVAFSVLVPVGIALFAYKMIPRAYQTYDDRTEFAAAKKLPIWSLHFIARGIITPQSTRQSYQSIISSCRHPSPMWPSYPFWGPIIMMIGGFIHPTTVTGCVALFSALAAAYGALAVLVAIVQPLRSDCYNALEAIGKLLSGLILVCGAVGVWTDSPEMARRASSTAVIFGIIQIAVSALRLVYSLVVKHFDSAFDQDLVRLHVVWAHTTDSDATAKRFALPDEGDDDILRQVALIRDVQDADMAIDGAKKFGVDYPGDEVSKVELDIDFLPSKEGVARDFESDSLLKNSDGTEVPASTGALAALDAQNRDGGTSSFSSATTSEDSSSML
eukprot:GILJ01018633.1.p1 GENE.GILJ01018633.1~~GILJ01018633.1.p1  ORF type:complete len:758 (-),score=81.88 GILJ01018633.1:273-2243(-)